MFKSKLYKIFEGGLTVATMTLVFLNSASAQTVSLPGTSGGANIMAMGQWIANCVWWVCCTGCFLEICFAGYKFSKGDQQGWGFVLKALGGTIIVLVASGIFKFAVFGAQNAGVSNTGNDF